MGLPRNRNRIDFVGRLKVSGGRLKMSGAGTREVEWEMWEESTRRDD